ncbi:putative B-box zinc finger protein 23 [Iris pallida]|uniref:B-box zinc finger protein 23 n=1 Tax=Iris pallida TaxID=29817 RepID=A0AAX6ED19_IRIPA|nr:putative B-box zinc finger protein 23 [Iris pallida]
MKIQCDVCEKAEATVLCCADEAALCWSCDEKVHAANKLAEKHQRVPLLLPSNSTTPSSSHLPTCDICQEKAGYFFCLEDRAILCRHCDVGIHTASPYGSSHQRFLVTGVRVALQHCLANNSNTNDDRSNSSSSNGNSGNPLASRSSEASIANRKMSGSRLGFDVPEAEGQGLKAEWMWNEVFAKSEEFDLCFGISEPGSSS